MQTFSKFFFQATKKIIDANHEYAGIAGIPALNKVSAELVFGENAQVLADKRVSFIATFK